MHWHWQIIIILTVTLVYTTLYYLDTWIEIQIKVESNWLWNDLI